MNIATITTEKFLDEDKPISYERALNSYEMEIWFEALRDPHSYQFTIAYSVQLSEGADFARLRSAAEQVLKSEPAYHKVFLDQDPPKVRVDFGEVWVESCELMNEEGAAAFFTEWTRKSWDLSKSPLINITVGKMNDAAVLMVRAHHIVADSWGVNLLCHKILDVYEGNEVAQLERMEAVRHYAAKHPVLNHTELERVISDVVEEIRHVEPALLPKSGADFSTSHKYRRSFSMSANEVAAGLENGFTPFLTVSTALSVLLSNVYGSENFFIGVPFLNRSEEELAIINQKANTLPVKVEVAHGSTLRDIGAGIKTFARFLKDKESIPFGRIISALARSGAPRQLFDATVSYQRHPQVGVASVVEETFRNVGHVHAQEAIVVHLYTYGDNADVLGQICLNNSAFSSENAAQAFLDSLIQLIRDVGKYLDKPVSDVKLLPLEQDEQLQRYEHGPVKQYSENDTVMSLFAARATQHPENIAIRDPDGNRLTYAQLDQWSSAVAAALEERAIGQGDIVAVSMVRSSQMMAAIFGVLKAGAVYLPIDSDYPADRIQYMLQDSDAKSVISDLPHVIKQDDPRWFDLSAVPTELASAREYRIKTQPHDPAYVIYTSGSTGRPKGVVVAHHSVVNRLEWMQEIHPLSREDVILQKTPISFDVSVWELFWWAITGASVALLKQGAQRDPRALIQAISDHGVTVAHFVPSMLEPYVQALTDERQSLAANASLKCLFTSGEALTPAVVNRYKKLFSREMPPPRLINLYGPTEATVDVTYYELDLKQDSDVDSVPIGFPINNTAVRIVSRHGARQPIGMAGELQISGVQLAQGYLNQPELTAERFIIDQNDNGSCWYRTGDLAAWSEDGALLYLGRMDGQVKIRGNRIELGEIKNALLGLPDVLNAEVIVEDDENRGKHLVALYVSRRAFNERDLREQLGALLPVFMIPARFVELDEMPLTPNGKFDRARALEGISNQSVFVPVGELTETEAIVVKIWGKVLGQHDIAVDDDFYSLGGDSILMLKIRSELEMHGYEVNLSELGEHTTVRRLGYFLENTSDMFSCPREALHPFELVRDVEQKRLGEMYDDAYPVSQLQLGLLFHSREVEGARAYKDVFRYTLKSAWNDRAFKFAVQQLIRRHPALRTVFNLSDFERPMQMIRKNVPVDDVLSITTPTRAEYERMIAGHMDKWSKHNYSLTSGPLFHIAIFVHHQADCIDLVLSFHHAILDGGSVANLIRELLVSYFQGGESSDLGYPEHELPNPSVFVQDELNALGSDEHRNYWKAYLDGADNALPIGLASHLGAADHGIFSYRFLIEPELDTALSHLAKRVHVPIKLVYLAAHCMAMAAMSGTTDVVTGVVTHARPEVQHSEHILGLFLNTLPLRVGLEDLNWLQLLEVLYQNDKRSHKHRRFPLSQIQAENGAISIQTAFNYIHFHVLQDVTAKTDIELLAFEPKEETNFAILTNVMRDFAGGQTIVRVDMDGNIYAKEQGEVFFRLFNSALARIAYQSQMPVSLNRPLTDVGCLIVGTKPLVSLPARIQKAVQHHPSAVAVTYDDTEWCYQQLWDAATRIAALLTESGVGKQDVVGLALPRSFEQIATVIAILRLGAVCLPVDLSYPASRIELILSIAEPAVVVTTCHMTALPVNTPCLVLEPCSFEGDTGQIEDAVIDPDDAAYILFTSGSTGTPKGVTMPHRGLANLVDWQNKTSSGAQVSSTLQLAPLSFDVSFQEILSTLSSGATLHLIGETERRDPATLIRHLDRKGVARVFMPYIALQQFAETAVTLDLFPKQLRVVVSSGEQLRVTQEIRTLMSHLPAGVLENQYGPTETHVVTSYSMRGDPEYFPAFPPIGMPISGAGLLLLDECFNVVPDGVPGEICVFGEALASGYYCSPEETSKKFIEHTDVPGKVLYRTGDIGIRAARGEIVSLGRNDIQVKVRGYRIEPSEIELKTLEFFEQRGESVDVAVVARPRDELDTYLIAYLTGKGGHHSNTLDDLRQFLSAELPAYMVPTHITWIDTIPKTPSGKRDDAQLRQLDIQIGSTRDYREPQNDYESRLCHLVAELLKITEIAPEQSIFDCGATSITAMRIVVLVEKLYGVNVPLSAFVSAPTIAKLARLIQDDGGHLQFDPLVPLRESGQRRPIFLVHPMGGNILSYLRMLPHLPSDQPFYALQAAGVDVGSTPIATVEEQARFYIEAIKRVQPTGPYIIGGWSYGGFIAFEMAAQLIQAGELVSNVLILDTMALNSHAKGKTSDDALLSWFFWELLWTSRGSALPVQVVPEHIETLQERFDYITNHAIAIGAVPAGSTKAVLQRLFEVYRTNWQAATDYNHNARYPELDMTLVRAKQPLPRILRDMHDSIGSKYHDPFNGWRSQTSGQVNLIEVEGDHLTIMEEPFVGPLVSAILSEIK
ncbi:amino acid adenylation domain-containing protein [Vibrio spartinae]|uniref:Dimodular nonribosomal peptide synthase n=1 Tax=Vibrio spartinae TaxID=1918945 RepID=A0ABX6R0G6_9VIBR|nr:non-ribosomal peptide synthetase [Vibrio spartinae]QMV14757.1 Dimodular nonribosomal peptide synthase [Vibrio spartinae]